MEDRRTCALGFPRLSSTVLWGIYLQGSIERSTAATRLNYNGVLIRTCLLGLDLWTILTFLELVWEGAITESRIGFDF